MRQLGDLSVGLEHAVRAVELLAEDAAPEARIDHLARLADCLGLSGDLAARERYDAELLQEAAASVAGDAGSFAARMGGEEFLLVLVGPDASAAARHLEDVRRAVGTHPWAELTGDLPVTVSVGAASFAGHRDTTVAELFGRADGHLYLAERAGRDRVVSDAS